MLVLMCIVCDMLVSMVSLVLVPLFFDMVSGPLICVCCPCWQLRMLTRPTDLCYNPVHVCEVFVITTFSMVCLKYFVMCIKSHISTIPITMLCLWLNAFPRFQSALIVRQKHHQIENRFFTSTTNQQSPMTMMQHCNKGPLTGTHLHIPLTPKVL